MIFAWKATSVICIQKRKVGTNLMKIKQWKKKLAKTTFFITVIFVAALFLGTAASTGVTYTKMTQTMKKSNTNALFIAPTSCASFDSRSHIKSETSGPNPLNHRGEIIFNQGYYLPSGPWTGYTSDQTLGYLCCEDFWNLSQDICDVEWYGLDFIWSMYVPSDPTDQTYRVIFYEDNGSKPGAVIADFTGLLPLFEDTGYAYDGWGEVWHWSIELPEIVSLSAGWVSIQSVYAPDGGAFLWVIGPDGNNNGEQNGVNYGVNFAYSLTAGELQYEHDVGVTKIVQPSIGNAATITPKVQAKNFGNNSEYSVPVECTIQKKVFTNYLTEDFEGTFPPAGWTVQTVMGTDWKRNDFWSRPNTAGSGYCADADVSASGNYPTMTMLISPSFDLSTASGALLDFDSYEYVYYNDFTKVDVSIDGGVSWTNAWQIVNSYKYGVYEHVSVDLSAYGGQNNVQVRFAYWSPYWDMYWQVDNVQVRTFVWSVENDQTTYIDMPWNTTTVVTFSDWTPFDMGLAENVYMEYKVDAQTQLFGDMYTANDLKTKLFTLHYGYFNDVAVVAINSPVSGPAASQIPEVAISNNGQNAQNVNVNMVISKIVYGAPWTIDGANAWSQSYSNIAGGTAPEAMLSWYMIQNSYAWMQSASVDTSAEPTLTLSFRTMLNNYAGGDYNCKVLIRANDADPWSDVTPWSNPIMNSIPATQYTVDVTAYKGPATSVQFEFTGNYFDLNYWYIDDFSLGTYYVDFTGAFPPQSYSLIPEYEDTVQADIAAGATMNVSLALWYPDDLPVLMNIDYKADVTLTLNGYTLIGTYGFEDYVSSAGGWTIDPSGTWQQYNYYTPGYATPCAYIPYYSAWDWTDNSFTSPAVDTTGYGTLTLSFASYISWYSDADTYFYVEATADGVNWYDVTPWSNPVTGNIGPSFYYVDISAYISTQTQVRFRFYGYAYDFNDWYIDDVSFGPYYTDFSGAFPPGGTPAYLPGWTETAISGSLPQFYTVGSNLQYPYLPATPRSGSYMEEYNSYTVPTGSSARLSYDTPLDLQAMGFSGYQMKFWMYWYGFGNDYLDVQASTDGSNWNTVGHFTDPYGAQSNIWTEQTVDLSAYANEPQVYLAFLGYSAWGYNMFVDDISILGATQISDGNLGDNTMSKIFSLSYEHDVGVVAITEPSGPPMKDEAYLKYDNGVYANAFGSTTGEIYAANRFTPTEVGAYIGWNLDSIMWNHYDAATCSGYVKIFDAGTPTQPGALLTTQAFTVDGAGWFNITLDNPVPISGNDIWLCTDVTHLSGQYPDTCSAPGISTKTAWFSSDGTTWYDLPSLGYDVSFMLRGHVSSPTTPGDWPPGTYPVAGVVKNIGVTYTETNIPVEAKITHVDNSTVIYDEFATVPGPLIPGASVTVTFPDFTLANLTAWEGKYKVEIMTALPGDAHPNNDKKSMTFAMAIPDILPPISNHTITGTMGLNGWYVSNVVVTITAYDPFPPIKFGPKPPSGVNHTYYKLHAADPWTEYIGSPVTVSTDGIYELFYYSVDKKGNTEAVKGPFAFKMDKTAPTIDLTVLAVNAMKNKWLLNATVADPTSGVAKVEFYVDDVLVGNATAYPYTYTYKGKGKVAQAIVYDKAGNSAMSAVVNEYIPDYNSQQNIQTPSFQQILLQK
jgi:hypothetical protein